MQEIGILLHIGVTVLKVAVCMGGLVVLVVIKEIGCNQHANVVIEQHICNRCDSNPVSASFSCLNQCEKPSSR